MQIGLSFFNSEKFLLGLEHEVLHMASHLDEDDEPIIETFDVFSIGLILVCLVISRKRKD